MTNNISLKDSTSNLFQVSPETTSKVQKFSILDTKRSKLENFVTAHKVALVVASFFLVGLVIWGILSHKINSLKSEQEGMINYELQQIAKDMNRNYVIRLDGKEYTKPETDPEKLKDALKEKGLTNNQVYTTLTLAHQGLYITAKKVAGDGLIRKYKEENPICYDEDYNVVRGQSNDPKDEVSYFTKDINQNELDMKFSIQVKDGRVSIQGDTQLDLQLQAPAPNTVSGKYTFHDIGFKPFVEIPQDVEKSTISTQIKSEKQHKVEITAQVAAPSA
ncbi:MAG: hypothetical protein JSS32_04440 [Verrucomicrobia bacterium]|nr:hypothetical protein [Verrucomicrobiota bacterium]